MIRIEVRRIDAEATLQKLRAATNSRGEGSLAGHVERSGIRLRRALLYHRLPPIFEGEVALDEDNGHTLRGKIRVPLPLHAFSGLILTWACAFLSASASDALQIPRKYGYLLGAALSLTSLILQRYGLRKQERCLQTIILSAVVRL